MKQPAKFSDTNKTFLLIDGAKINGLSQIIYHEETNPYCDALYRTTALADLVEISPWLVETSMTGRLAGKCFDEWKHLGAAIVLQADCEFDELIAHLRGLIRARVSTGDDVIFRFYDPEIIRFLMKSDPNDEDEGREDIIRLLGPCRSLAIQDRRTGEWENFYKDQPSCEVPQEIFNIREKHLVSMERAAEQTALRKLELHTANYFPHLLQQPGGNGQDWSVVFDLVSAAKKRGLNSTRDIALYINTIGWLGNQAFEDGDVQNLWNENSEAPGKAIVRIAEFAEKKSTEGLVHG